MMIATGVAWVDRADDDDQREVRVSLYINAMSQATVGGIPSPKPSSSETWRGLRSTGYVGRAM